MCRLGPESEAKMLSAKKEQGSVQDGYGRAFEKLTEAFGDAVAVPGGFRWCLDRSGHEVRIELASMGRHSRSDIVWIFDPSARGLSSFFSFDVNTADGLAWLDMEVRRLQRRG